MHKINQTISPRKDSQIQLLQLLFAITAMSDKDKGAQTQLKKLVNGLESNRKNVQSGIDVPSNISKAKEVFNQFQGVIRGQTSTIAAIKTFQKSMVSQNARTLQVKKFFMGYCDRMKIQMTKLMKISEEIFSFINPKSSKSTEVEKNVSEVIKMMTSIKEEADTSQKMYSGVYKLLNIKDNILCQILRIMIYKKNILWKDLNIKFDDYIHSEVKLMLNKIKENQQKYGYIPNSLSFKMPKIEIGYESPLADLVAIVFQDESELIDSIKNFSKLSDEPQLIEDISKNQHIVKGLRDKIETLTKNYSLLLQKYRSLQVSKGKMQLGQNQQKSLGEKIEELENTLLKKDQDIIELKQVMMKNDSTIQGLKDKNKELEDEISKWQNFQLPKIKELEFAQKTLLEEFSKTKRDFQMYNVLYQSGMEEKIKAFSDLKGERNRLNEMANILGRERRKIKQLNAELIRKDQIIFELVEKAPDP